jgi:ribosomal-protein-alanine N-acetyltransferase
VKIRRLSPEDTAAASALDPRWSVTDLARIAGGEFPDRMALVAESPGGHVAGLLLASLLPPEAEILNIVVQPEARRHGLGLALMQAALKEMAATGVTGIRLEVRASSTAALRLYQRLGFRQTGRRPQYYHDPDEDALLLESILKRP